MKGYLGMIDGLRHNVYHIRLILTFDEYLTASITQLQHTVYQIGDTVCILRDSFVNISLFLFWQFYVWLGQYLRETRDDIQWRTNLVGDVTDKLTLHLRRHLCPFVGNTQLFIRLLLSDGITPA